MKLKEAGLYLIVGMEYAVLAFIEGEGQFLDFSVAMSMNNFIHGRSVKALDKDSLEIQNIKMNPENFSYFPIPLTDEIFKTKSLSQKYFFKKMCNLNDEQLYNVRLKSQSMSKSMLMVWMTKEYSISFPQARYVYELITKQA